ncbi:unnamed protein product [Cylicostephanus goldi]|uniref:Apple domain-containing protein n=1 Tax=Cylicostephanus goldi TaxID=71465 RepID=A0A3P7PI38_CYLGO|nr:unnamed protein product [Cylicostephanus goldi]
MKCSALFLLVIQVGSVSSCVFDKVEKMSVALIYETILDKNECFAACYNNKNCIALAYYERIIQSEQ